MGRRETAQLPRRQHARHSEAKPPHRAGCAVAAHRVRFDHPKGRAGSFSPALWGGKPPPKGRAIAFLHTFPHTCPQHAPRTEDALSLRERFAAFLHPKRGEIVALTALQERVALLEAREIAHDVAWAEAKEQISRHLKRVAEVERRAKERENGHGQLDALDQLVLSAKLRGGS